VADLVGDAVAHLARVGDASGVGGVRVVARVEERDLVAREVGQRPQLVERDDRRVRDLDDHVLEVVDNISSASAISASVGARWSSCSRRALTRSISRARARTERGTQSSERSSSMIPPFIRVIANVSNLTSRSGSKRSTAEISPTRP